MTAPGNVSAKKLAGDYLADLTHVALRYLPKGDRMKFVGRTQALIERRCGPLAEAEPGRVAAVLAELGEPRDLVMRERQRLDVALAKRRSAGSSPAAPWEQRPITSRWRPATGDRLQAPRSGRLPGGKRSQQDPPADPPPAADQDAAAVLGTSPHSPPRRLRRFRMGGRARAAGQPAATAAGEAAADGPAAGAAAEPPAPQPAATDEAGQDLARDDAPAGEWSPPMAADEWLVLEEAGHEEAVEDAAAPGLDPDLAGLEPAGLEPDGQPEPDGAGPAERGDLAAGLAAIEPTSVVPPGRALPPVPAGTAAPGPPTIPGLTLPDSAGSEIVPASDPPATLVPWTPAGMATLAKGNRREALAVILLALGGLLPLPFWLLGAAVAGFSRFWEARYRWVALYGPALITLVLTIPLAAITGGRGNAIAVYLHLVLMDARWLVRVGCILTAAYLTWLVRRGPRERIPPWRR